MDERVKEQIQRAKDCGVDWEKIARACNFFDISFADTTDTVTIHKRLLLLEDLSLKERLWLAYECGLCIGFNQSNGGDCTV